jgi:hypothetical protein
MGDFRRVPDHYQPHGLRGEAMAVNQLRAGSMILKRDGEVEMGGRVVDVELRSEPAS